jgi:hypothetical protein
VAVYRHTPFGNIAFSPYKRKLSVDKNKNKGNRKKIETLLCAAFGTAIHQLRLG